ncbi:MAG: peptide deformylase [Bacilli bacterium]
MLTYKEIIKEEDQRLREKSLPVTFPLEEDNIALLETLSSYLLAGYDSDFAEKNDIRPGVGLAAPQLGILKQIFVVAAFDEAGELYHFGVINPKIVSHSEEQAYIPTGEGCLSVDREVQGLVHRSKRISLSAHYYNFSTKELTKQTLKLHDYIAIVCQHELDHLHGVLFVDRIDPINPFYIPENSTPIVFPAVEPEED